MTGLSRIGASVAVLAMFATSACAPTDRRYQEPGADFALYDRWDADASGGLDTTEFYGGMYDAWDVDDDGVLTEEEFDAGTETWYGTDEADFDAWDVDESGFLTADEAGVGLAEWERDTSIIGFGDWDTNESGLIENEEFTEGFHRYDIGQI